MNREPREPGFFVVGLGPIAELDDFEFEFAPLIREVLLVVAGEKPPPPRIAGRTAFRRLRVIRRPDPGKRDQALIDAKAGVLRAERCLKEIVDTLGCRLGCAVNTCKGRSLEPGQDWKKYVDDPTGPAEAVLRPYRAMMLLQMNVSVLLSQMHLNLPRKFNVWPEVGGSSLGIWAAMEAAGVFRMDVLLDSLCQQSIVEVPIGRILRDPSVVAAVRAMCRAVVYDLGDPYWQPETLAAVEFTDASRLTQVMEEALAAALSAADLERLQNEFAAIEERIGIQLKAVWDDQVAWLQRDWPEDDEGAEASTEPSGGSGRVSTAAAPASTGPWPSPSTYVSPWGTDESSPGVQVGDVIVPARRVL